MDPTIDLMQEQDLAEIALLQEANLRVNLDSSRLREGYLSIAFSDDQFRAFNRNLGVVVARVDGQLAGYCCVSGAAFNAGFPILDQIVANLADFPVPGVDRVPTIESTCMYGPACIAGPYRGKGVLAKLFGRAAALSKQAGYDFCFSFVSSGNERSLRAHLKLPFSEVGRVSHAGKTFIVIACRL